MAPPHGRRALLLRLGQLLVGIVWLTGLLSVAGCLARLWWPLELASHFPVQYFMVLAVCALLLFAGRKPWSALAALGFALFNLAWIAPVYWSEGEPIPTARTYRVLFLNLFFENHSREAVLHFLPDADPDIILFAEMNPDWMLALHPLRSKYPCWTSQQRDAMPEVVLLSRFPLEEVEDLDLGNGKGRCVRVRTVLEGQRLTLIGAHLTTPKRGNLAGRRNRELACLAQCAAGQKGPVMIVGDLNCTPWSPYFQDLLHAAGLRDSRQGFGLQPTWPAWLPLPGIPIDHCLVSPGVSVRNRWVGPDVGSDHYPVVVDFSLKGY